MKHKWRVCSRWSDYHGKWMWQVWNPKGGLDESYHHPGNAFAHLRQALKGER